MDRKFQQKDLEADRRPCPELPTEIIFSLILPRLRPHILIWYRLVCKSWSSLIRSPYFVTAYRNFPRCRTNLLFEKRQVSERGLRFFSSQIDQKGNPSPVAELFRHPSIPDVHSANGLLCVTVACPLIAPDYIYNPSTGKSIQLPLHVVETDGKQASSARYSYYFGFSPLTNEYKVLEIVSFFDPKALGTCQDIVFNTFTLGTDSWRPLHIGLPDLPIETAHLEIFTGHAAGLRNKTVCLNGAIHWMYEKQNSIVVFDLEEETFRVIPLPEDYESPQNDDNDDYLMRCTCKTVPGIVEVGGCVGVFLDKSWEQNVMELWILKDYQNQAWVKETISLMSILRGGVYGRCYCYINALCTIHTGELALVVGHFGGSPGYDNCEPELHLYNMKTKQYRKLDFIFPKEAINSNGEDPIYLLTSYEDSIV